MEQINISILRKKPELNAKVIFQLEPLAPLSMVSELPGSFYKSLTSPTKKMLCGLFENILGWHLSYNHRTALQKELIKFRRKQKIDYKMPQNGSTYIPLLMEFFDIELVTIPEYFMYNDMWSKAYRRADADVHPKGTPNIDYRLIPVKRNKPRDSKKPKQIANDELLKLFLTNKGKFPLYYSTPTTREFTEWSKVVEIILLIDKELLELIKTAIQINNLGYLGTSEGWVNLKIKEHE